MLDLVLGSKNIEISDTCNLLIPGHTVSFGLRELRYTENGKEQLRFINLSNSLVGILDRTVWQ